MLDRPKKTAQLLAALESALPFEVKLTEPLGSWEDLPEGLAPAHKVMHVVSRVSYAGDEGGIMCHIEPVDGRQGIVISLTYVRVSGDMPLATAVADYQKHRSKKLKRRDRRLQLRA